MSASLVGSEMCIRDRNGPLHGSAMAKSRRPQIPQVQAQEAPRFVRCLPVSYTHLTLPTICSV
eukprot:13933831-Alexandrium_andersonii.AAC.1